VFAGKAHPKDEHGKQLLQMVADFAQQRGLSHRLVFIEDFDLTTDRALSQGVDLWLNTPRRPLEACGIGGMKAGVNGALNLSTLDGWWDEAWHDAVPGAPPIGWSIGTADTYEDHDLQDAVDAESLYHQLEHDIVPRFFDRNDDGVPHRWLDSVRQSMATLAVTWRSHRMLHEYVDDLYVPGAARADRLAADDALRARRLAASIERVERAWHAVQVEIAGVDRRDDTVTVDIVVRLGELSARDVTVDLWIEPRTTAPYPVAAHRVDAAGAPTGSVSFQASVHVGGPEADFAARVTPLIEDAPSRFQPGLIAWSH
jgi:starch phosphorylase